MMVVGHAVRTDLMAGGIGRLDSLRPFLDGETIGADRALDVEPVENIQQPPYAYRAAVIGVRERCHIERDLRRLLETPALAERLVSDPERAAHELSVGPFQRRLRPLDTLMHRSFLW